MSKPLIYIAHPISGDPIANAGRAMHFLRAFLAAGHNAIAPYILPLRMEWVDDDDPEVRELELQRMEVIAAMCDVVAACGPHVTDGVNREAKACGRYMLLTGLDPEVAATMAGDRNTPIIWT